MNPAVFKGVPQLQYRAIVARIRAQAGSITDDGNSGSAVGHTPLGEMASERTYDATAQILTVTVTKKPFGFSDSLLLAKMQSLVDSTKA